MRSPAAGGWLDGRSLGAGVIGVVRRLEMQDEAFDVLCAGGVHSAGSVPLDTAFRTTLAASCPASEPVMLSAPPAIGAALLALEQIVVVDAELHDRLLDGVAGAIAT